LRAVLFAWQSCVSREIFTENEVVKRIILCLVMAAGCLAKDPEAVRKPACKAPIHGQFWPDAANTDGRAAQQLAKCGALEICAHAGWKYKWQSVAVNVRQLGKAPQEPTAACAAVMEEFGGKDR
jgi:hypothetical protein